MKRRQHIVPVGYLKQFTFDQNKTHVYAFFVGEATYKNHISIKDCCVQKDFYKAGEKENELENEFSTYENNIVNSIRKSISLLDMDKEIPFRLF